MNQFFYESRGKEKIRDLMEEGMRSQAVHRSSAPKTGHRAALPRLLIGILTLAGLLGLLVR